MDFNVNWGGSGIEKCLYNFIVNKFPKCSEMLELGGGNCSTKVFSTHFNLTTIEEDPKWINIHPSRYILAEIKNGWYDSDVLKSELKNNYDVIFVDGPKGEGNRAGVLNNLDLFNKNAVWIFHDTYRASEKKLSLEIAKALNKEIVFYSECDYWCVIQ